MKRFVLLACVAVLLLAVAGLPAHAQNRNVTFLVNTASVPDTIKAGANVVVTGAGDPVLTDWGAGLPLDNIGGDYWSKTVSIPNAANLFFKIRIGSGGWEENTTAGSGNREVTVSSDTTVGVMYWNNGHFPAGKNIGIYDGPFTPLTDTISVWVRVNIKAVADNGLYGWTAADYDSVCIMGGGSTGSNLDWGTPFYLTRETDPTNSSSAFTIPSGTFYSGRLRFPKSSVTEGQEISYKFRLGSQWTIGSTERSEQIGANRVFTIPVGKKDTTLQWVYFGNVKPTAVANTDTVIVTYRVNVQTAIQKGSFSIGDTLQVQRGFFQTADSTATKTMVRQGLSFYYVVTDTMLSKVGKMLDYQYYLNKNGSQVREYFYNFQYAGSVNAEAERRQVLVSSKAFTVVDDSVSTTSGRRQPYFENQGKLSKPVTVRWQVDLRPAYYQVWAGDSLHAIQGNLSVLVADSITLWGVAMNGPATGGPNGPLESNWATWGRQIAADSSQRKMWDDGTHGDLTAGDTVYTVLFNYTTLNTIGQVFKFGIGGSDNESGYGLNHLDNITVGAGDTVSLMEEWGSINPNFYDAWDYNNHRPANPTDVTTTGGVPEVYALQQNFPNPFNPSTKIAFSIPKQSRVELKVYNMLGQEVAVLVDENLPAGNHSATFNPTALASGVYLYKITAGSFVATKKMLLLK